MIFQELNKLKRSTIMTSIILIVIGILMVLCPEEYTGTMIGLMGAVLLVLPRSVFLNIWGATKP